MEYFSSDEESSTTTVITQTPKKNRNISLCLSVCMISFKIKQTLSLLSKKPFVHVSHPSAFNIYMKEKGKEEYREDTARDSLNRLQLFLSLCELGIECRIVYKIRLKDLAYEESLDIVSGRAVISDSQDFKSEHINIAVTCYGTVINNTIYGNKKITAALESEIPRNTNENCPFYKHDCSHLNILPTNRKEGNMHPLYRIEPDNKRYLIYPKTVGAVGMIKDTTKRHIKKSKIQKDNSLKIYPISHLHRLLTYNEILQRNKTLIDDAIPFRIIKKDGPKMPRKYNKYISPGKKQVLPLNIQSTSSSSTEILINPTLDAELDNESARIIKVYAPWQITNKKECITNQPQYTSVIIPNMIPKDMVYLLETELIKHNIPGIGYIPYIGNIYNYHDKRIEKVYSGLLLTKTEYTSHKTDIVKHMHSSLIRAIIIQKSKLILNIQVISNLCMQYLDVLSNIS
ncbi:hypothetical protein NEIRO02_1607 [Nematocida sp. AWRm79]|nr:hypothetical protein NEIRO02_1607 [Nematocida sp. AWRm79]